MIEVSHGVDDSLWTAGNSESVVRRVWYALPVCGVLVALAGGYAGGWRFAAGAAVGTLLAMANFRFLSNSLRSILGSGNEKPAPGTTMMFVFRWVIVATAAFAIYRTGYVAMGGLIAGLFTPAIATAFEALYQVAHVLTHPDGSEDNESK